jgi:hypothetical protein
MLPAINRKPLRLSYPLDLKAPNSAWHLPLDRSIQP